MIVINMNLQENIKRILREETSDDILAIKNILELTVMKDYEDLICDIFVTDIKHHTYKYMVEFIFLREKEPTRISDYDKYMQVKIEAEDLINYYTNIDVWVQDAYVKQCG